ncbi:hypothetical protein [Bacillus sonorensis]|uniref:Uncharacterized protein n=1 Tax=Bacillus sonorensis TaxID=119858 RepID=A0ABN5ALW3_9BACI|nr:hypothetical protein [Bacillus sonorensis]ASB90438.1 hypothetical protein S101395_03934 [Bacillus sonorensis]RHJ13891.1 hypothetical protein DW143_04725 [Bacillus sonorensis]WPP37711.1 hypothetical protein SK061_05665 [Bacillus sonorensis]
MAEPKRESIEMGSNQMYETGNAADRISVKIDVDVSDAITGLKAIQREAKAATKALAELREEQQNLSIEGAARVLEKFLESPDVDTLKLKDALGILTSTERHRLVWGEIRESWKAENDEGEL